MPDDRERQQGWVRRTNHAHNAAEKHYRENPPPKKLTPEQPENREPPRSEKQQKPG